MKKRGKLRVGGGRMSGLDIILVYFADLQLGERESLLASFYRILLLDWLVTRVYLPDGM